MRSRTLALALLGIPAVTGLYGLATTADAAGPAVNNSSSNTPGTAPAATAAPLRRRDLPGLVVVSTSRAGTRDATAALLVTGQALRNYTVGSRIEGSSLVLVEVRADGIVLKDPEADVALSVGITPASEVARRWSGYQGGAPHPAGPGEPAVDPRLLPDADNGAADRQIDLSNGRWPRRRHPLGTAGSV